MASFAFCGCRLHADHAALIPPHGYIAGCGLRTAQQARARRPRCCRTHRRLCSRTGAVGSDRCGRNCRAPGQI